MKQAEKEVMSKSVKVGTAVYDVYESVDEAVGKLGAEAILKLVNAQIRTNAMNVVRSNATGKPSETRFREMAQEAFLKSPDAAQRFAECAGAPERWNALMDQWVEKVKTEWFAAHPAAQKEEEED